MKTYPLHNAVLRSDIETVNSLIANGIELNELDEHGQSALHWAVLRGDADIVKALLAAGADPNVMSNDGFTPKWSAVDFGLQNIELLLADYDGIVATNDKFDKQSWTAFKGLLCEPMPKNEKSGWKSQ